MSRNVELPFANLDFTVFLIVWNQKQGQDTPAVHLRMAKWLQDSWRNGDTRLLLMAFRSCGKSTLAGLFAAWLLCCQPDLRVIVMAADSLLARKMVRNVKRIIERHPLCDHLMPETRDQWASDKFTVRRDKELRDPSMLARGITTNITGARADVFIYDDVEVPNTSDTLEKRQDLRDRLTETDFVLVSGGTKLYIGTPHSYDTIYRTKAGKGKGLSEPFLLAYKSLLLPILKRNGESQWPERFSSHDIEALKRSTGLNKFTSQMMLRPVDIRDCRLNPDLLETYEAELHYSEAGGGLPLLTLGDKKIASVSAFWDPAFGAAKGDDSALAIVLVDTDGHEYIHSVSRIRFDPDIAIDEATQQARQVARILTRFFSPSVTIEINGIGKFLPSILRREIAAMKEQIAVVEKASSVAKTNRILEAFDARLAARMISVHGRVCEDDVFLTQMREWQPFSSKKHDDLLDAVAGAILQEPVRLKRISSVKGKTRWRSQPVSARTDFDPTI